LHGNVLFEMEIQAEQFKKFIVADSFHIGDTGAFNFDSISAEDVTVLNLNFKIDERITSFCF